MGGGTGVTCVLGGEWEKDKDWVLGVLFISQELPGECQTKHEPVLGRENTGEACSQAVLGLEVVGETISDH